MRMIVIIVYEEGISPRAYRPNEKEAALEQISQAIDMVTEIEVGYEEMTEEQFKALREFEGA
jgi:predicted metal-dependent TIM-barrel fold hydrolase